VRRLFRCRRRTSDFRKRSRSAHQVEGSEDKCLLLAPPDSRRVVCRRTLVPSCRDRHRHPAETALRSQLPAPPAQEPVVSEISRFKCSPPKLLPLQLCIVVVSREEALVPPASQGFTLDLSSSASARSRGFAGRRTAASSPRWIHYRCTLPISRFLAGQEWLRLAGSGDLLALRAGGRATAFRERFSRSIPEVAQPPVPHGAF
jgi:hypothetical protein